MPTVYITAPQPKAATPRPEADETGRVVAGDRGQLADAARTRSGTATATTLGESIA